MTPAGEEATVLDIMRYLGMECQHIKIIKELSGIKNGNRIKKFRTIRGLTQKELGIATGFNPESADIRIAQYENNSRNPRDVVIERMASVLNVSVFALKVPELSTYAEIMQILFYIEDIINDEKSNDFSVLLNEWITMKKKQKLGEISQAAYDDWRYQLK